MGTLLLCLLCFYVLYEALKDVPGEINVQPISKLEFLSRYGKPGKKENNFLSPHADLSESPISITDKHREQYRQYLSFCNEKNKQPLSLVRWFVTEYKVEQENWLEINDPSEVLKG
jgi:hypothetical protein